MAKKKDVKPVKSKAKNRDKPAQMIRNHIQMAEHLSSNPNNEEDCRCPTIAVQWAPAVAACNGVITPESIHKYDVYVGGIVDSCRWEITGQTEEELSNQLAASLEEYARYLEEVARFLRSNAQRYRMNAEHEARKAK